MATLNSHLFRWSWLCVLADQGWRGYRELTTTCLFQSNAPWATRSTRGKSKAVSWTHILTLHLDWTVCFKTTLTESFLSSCKTIGQRITQRVQQWGYCYFSSLHLSCRYSTRSPRLDCLRNPCTSVCSDVPTKLTIFPLWLRCCSWTGRFVSS